MSRFLLWTSCGYFYPRPPRGGRRGDLDLFAELVTFLSTPSARRATRSLRSARLTARHFYPRPPRGGRPAQRSGLKGLLNISIHALREEGDDSRRPYNRVDCQFLSTPSARRATRAVLETAQGLKHFYPRPPRGGRQQKQRQNLYFQTNYTTFCTNLEEP